MKKGMMINSSMIKIGKFENGEQDRKKDYKKTYGPFFEMEIIWSGNLDKKEIRKLESCIKKELNQYRYRNPLTNYPSEYIDIRAITLPEIRQQMLAIVQKYITEEELS